MTATYEVVYGEVTRRTDRREHYHERWQRAVERELTFGLYVPAPGTVTCIMPGSAIIGSPSGDRLQLHFEGAKCHQMGWKTRSASPPAATSPSTGRSSRWPSRRSSLTSAFMRVLARGDRADALKDGMDRLQDPLA